MNSNRSKMLIAFQICAVSLYAAFIASSAGAQTPNRTGERSRRPGVRARSAFTWPLPASASALTPAAGPVLPVIGGGTFGRITKWTGFGTNAVIGDSTIFEDKSGKVGIGTDSPASRLTVVGIIETTIGGLKFPDGTVQASAGLGSISHDATLTGDGSSGSPLGTAIPLNLIGNSPTVVLEVRNTGGGAGLDLKAGDSTSSFAEFGIQAVGGEGVGATTGGGEGIVGAGGRGKNGPGGDGVLAAGGEGNGAGNKGGSGIFAIGGGSFNGATKGPAGTFIGDVNISGNLSKGGGSFKIDHPLDPENKYLYHSFVESPDMKNIYDGTVTTDQNGDATITLPDYFGALNRDFRYQLTVIGTFAQAIVSGEIENNQFRIRTSAPGVKVSWQVTGIRQDAYANRHRIPVEELKSDLERGSYLHPDVFNLPEEKNVLFVQRPLLMKHERVLREAATGRQK